MTEPLDQPTRTCRRCSTTTSVPGDFCPSCGTSFVRRSRRPSRRTVIVATVVAVLVGAGAAGLLVKQHADQQTADRAAAASERLDRQRAGDAAAAQVEADAAERSARADLVEALQDEVTKDAKEKVDDDLLEGPILYSSCTATGGGSTDDLTALTGTFECLAVNEENADGTASGYRYSGTADWGSGSYTWRLGG